MASRVVCVLGVNGCDGVKGDEESPDGAATAAAIALEDRFCPGVQEKRRGASCLDTSGNAPCAQMAN